MSELTITPGKAAACFVKAFAEVEAVRKNGKMRDGGQSFDYQRYEDILPVVRAALVTAGLAPIPVGFEVTPEEHRKTRNGAMQYVVRIEATYRLIADDGSYVEGKGIGRGVDTGDKDISKAQTYAYKWFLTQTFQITTKDQADPDGSLTEETVERETDAQRILRERREQDRAAEQPPQMYPLPAAAQANGQRPAAPVPAAGQELGQTREYHAAMAARNGAQQPQVQPPITAPLQIPADNDLIGWKQYIVQGAARIGFAQPNGQPDVPALAVAYEQWSGGASLPEATVPLLQKFAEHLKSLGAQQRPAA
ncbi:ERF family protein [Glutamicibacter sp. V16R2B1]|uniref:ERF family protein n=1 Tax=Glutamicibacter sp. V16R2B1 TaxID=2036207 RepID=UPI0010FCDB7E|nr:ERF family protein [Glutamicibacter sp. V16R2B1]MCK9901220.1 ERF family protein [Frankia sp. Cpl3]TLK47508.1 hypothetical protein FDN03_15740 [Glutamicibacter sp. V16R2B1]